MDGSLLLNLLALLISICAVAASLIFGTRQLAIARHANYIPALLDLLAEFRKVEFHEQYNFVCSRLREEYSPELGLSGLPSEVKQSVYSVAYFFQTLAGMYALGIIGEDVAMFMVRGRVNTVWRAIEPFVVKERESPVVDDHLLSILESFAADAEHFTGPPSADLLRARRGLWRGTGVPG
ncbi:hypothetical protein ACFY3E_15460 [Streptomyces griseorubiginosus]|uniref:DUF4760 domain-containing protein n=1 Tax=Streptomyces griseorubiginosus TaxID=67304 RepID=UPI0036B9BACA